MADFKVGDVVVDEWELRNNEDGAPHGIVEAFERDEQGFWWYKVTFPGRAAEWYDDEELELVK